VDALPGVVPENSGKGAAATAEDEQRAPTKPDVAEITDLRKIMSELKLEHKLPVAAKWCHDKGAQSVHELLIDDYAEQLAKELQLREIPAKRFIRAIKFHSTDFSCQSEKSTLTVSLFEGQAL